MTRDEGCRVVERMRRLIGDYRTDEECRVDRIRSSGYLSEEDGYKLLRQYERLPDDWFFATHDDMGPIIVTKEDTIREIKRRMQLSFPV